MWFILLVAIVIGAFLSVYKANPPVKNAGSTPVLASNVTSHPIMAVTTHAMGQVVIEDSKKTNEPVQVFSVTNHPFMVVTNRTTEQVAMVDFTKKVILFENKDGRLLWSVNVVDAIKNNLLGSAEIRDVKFDESNSNLLVVIGKHTYVTITASGGKLTFQGSD